MVHILDDLWACPECSLVSSQLPADISRYDEAYHAKYEVYAKTDLGKKLTQARWDLVKKYLPHGVILDFGSGSGHFARENPNGVHRVIQYDINPFSNNSSVSTLDTRVNAVTFWDSLEHVEDPYDLLDYLRPEFIFMTVPDAFSIPTHFMKSWRHYRRGEHVHYFSRPSLRRLAERLGYAILEFSTMEGDLRSPEAPDWLLTMAAEKIR
jgi:hypothetical protein